MEEIYSCQQVWRFIGISIAITPSPRLLAHLTMLIQLQKPDVAHIHVEKYGIQERPKLEAAKPSPQTCQKLVPFS